LFIGLVAADATASEAYVVRFFLMSFPNCFGILWQDDIVFHNTANQDLTVKLLGISNGSLVQPPEELRVPAGKTVTAIGKVNWRPQGAYQPIWIAHLEVPDGIVFQSRAEGFSTLCTGGAPPSPTPDRGAFPLPVTRSLTPANVRKTFLGADFGSDASHANVGVYNAASETAEAVVEMRQGCDEALLDRRTFLVPPNSVVQVGGVGGPTVGCQSSLQPTSPWTRYIAVTVNQASFSYVLNRLDDLTSAGKIPYLAVVTQE
jgi:hypothetical protein